MGTEEQELVAICRSAAQQVRRGSVLVARITAGQPRTQRALIAYKAGLTLWKRSWSRYLFGHPREDLGDIDTSDNARDE